MAIPFLDLSTQTEAVLEDFLVCVRKLARNNEFINGPTVRDFEKNFAEYCDAQYCVALNSGTDGLRLALMAAGVQAGDEVLTSPFTFVATTEAVTQTGKLVLADVDPQTFTLSPSRVEEKIGPRTRVLLPVHIFGLPAPVDELLVLVRRHELVLIEDACQAHGAAILDRKVGSFGQSAAFSFYPTKNLGAFGDAGAVTTSDETIDAAVRLLRNHGQVGDYEHEREGFNSRMDALQAALLELKLAFFEEWLQWRRRLAQLYRKELAPVEGVRFQKEPEGYRHSYHLLAALVEKRTELKTHLARRGIETKIVYPIPIHLQKAYRDLGHHPGDFPNAERICESVLCFPLYPGMSEEQVLDVCRIVKEFYDG